MKWMHLEDNGDGTLTATSSDGFHAVIPISLNRVIELAEAAGPQSVPDELVEASFNLVEIPTHPPTP